MDSRAAWAGRDAASASSSATDLAVRVGKGSDPEERCSALSSARAAAAAAIRIGLREPGNSGMDGTDDECDPAVRPRAPPCRLRMVRMAFDAFAADTAADNLEPNRRVVLEISACYRCSQARAASIGMVSPSTRSVRQWKTHSIRRVSELVLPKLAPRSPVG